MKTTNPIRQAITTRYMGPTNFRGSRIKASAERGSITVSWEAGGNADENHRAACLALLAKFRAEDKAKYNTSADNGWGPDGDWYGGSIDKADVIAWVRVPGLAAMAAKEENAP